MTMPRRATLLASAARIAPRAFDNPDRSINPDTTVPLPSGPFAPGLWVGMGNTIDGDTLTKRSPDSAAMLDYWDKTDDIVDGIDALRNAGKKYLPKFRDEQQTDYNFRLQTTKLTNVYRDICESLASKPFEQEISIVKADSDGKDSVPADILDFVEDVDGSGNNLTLFAGLTFFNGINSAIDWICVDFDKDDPNIRTVADAKAANRRPYWSHVLARNVLEVQSKVIGGKETLTYIRIMEPGNGSPDRVRVLTRSPQSVIVWTLYEKTQSIGKQSQFVVIDEGELSINVIPYVPFVTGRRDGRSFRYFPAMRDAADLQIELYLQESALKFVKLLTAYPMLSANGVAPEKEAGLVKRIAIGPGRVLYAPPSGSTGRPGSWAYIEPQATSLEFLAKDVDATIAQLRELGRQPLTAQSGNITVITAAVAAGKSKSAIKAWALGLKDALENALVITSMWLNITYEPEVNVYTEFDDASDNIDELPAIAMAYTNKIISRQTYGFELQRRGVLSPEYNYDTETDRLLEDLPDNPDENNIDPITGLPQSSPPANGEADANPQANDDNAGSQTV